MTHVYIHSYYVNYDDSDENVKEFNKLGVHYLTDKIDVSEAQVFFDQARKSYEQKADFEDKNYNKFTLIHNEDGTYTLKARDN